MPDCPVHYAQSKAELDWLIEQYRALNPRNVLEIGSLYGGTLWHWMANAEKGARFVSIDLIPDNYLYKAEDVIAARAQWGGWSHDLGMELHAIQANSLALATIEIVRKFAPFDFIFIDGGHDRKTVEGDFANYYPMVRPGGLMAFHDVAYDLSNPHCIEVGLWWIDLKATEKYQIRELVEVSGQWGIGVVQA